ncbi:TPA_exp: Serine carboxypeptidase [Trichophyton benhamiae CBS 112371]|uniref:Carboxypeptidase Y homolog ARB_07161 n=1 Tax=Arthroderma benhamiae (strain ATCC MYA-4681 / CBS 112371) TaxID=663331 RepID=SCPF_ARTBC|nr:RecName: Full=Carboxypeptidase Y homolog ARB_07161; AltName: Full=Serine carboxypeptidase ARB_07161; Flags: Precursor [Trichophyton benhamiae CBS 112371]DAA77173.1 TPA_exp: Serine carboxypeptidase [Trichophyton benhamiae CBS 112371]
MKGLLSLLLVGAANALAASYEPRSLTEDMLQGKEKEVWDAIKGEIPGAQLDDYFNPPTAHQREPDEKWDGKLEGKSVNTLWVEEGKDKPSGIEEYGMRFKTVDPSSLGVDNVTQYSGYLDNKKNGQHLFFWFFESRRDPQYDPVILWLNGGPGCSSMTSLFMELGPARVGQDLKLTRNPNSWNNRASIIFLDQPVNVGFSYGKSGAFNTPSASKDVFAFLTLFFKKFPQYALQDFHIAGESYAGHYIPFASYPPMACGKGGYSAVLDQPTCKAMEAAVPQCQKEIKRCYDKPTDVATCVKGAKFCKDALVRPYSRTGQSIYDIRGRCEDPKDLCYPILGWIAKYLNQRHVQKAIGAEVSHFKGCSNHISSQFFAHGDYNQPFHRKIPGILKDVNVLVYAGDADYICNWLGVKEWTEALQWPGRHIFRRKNLSVVYHSVNKWPLGRVKYHNGLAFLQVFKAGHRVPYDQPENALDFFNRWLAGEWTP